MIGVGGLIAGQSIQLVTGVAPDDAATELQLVLPESFVEPLGLGSDDDAVGQTVSIAITDADRAQHVVDATVVGVSEPGLASPTGASLVPNQAPQRRAVHGRRTPDCPPTRRSATRRPPCGSTPPPPTRRSRR